MKIKIEIIIYYLAFFGLLFSVSINAQSIGNEGQNQRTVYSKNSKLELVRISSDEPFRVVRKQEGWLIVVFQRPIVPAWVSQNHVTKTDNSVVVKSNNLNLRLKPSLNSRVLANLVTGINLAIAGQQQDGFLNVYAPKNTEFAIKSSSSKVVANTKLKSNDSLNNESRKKHVPSNKQFITLKGQVINAGPVAFEQGVTVREAILLAGGVGKNAALNGVDIFRKGKLLAVSLLIDSEKKLSAGDVIIVNRKKNNQSNSTITIHGNVEMPGQYLHQNKQTVSSIVLLAGGFTKGAKRKVSILRRSKEDGSMKKLKNIKAASLIEKNDIINVD